MKLRYVELRKNRGLRIIVKMIRLFVISTIMKWIFSIEVRHILCKIIHIFIFSYSFVKIQYDSKLNRLLDLSMKS
jgi:hypothetical protein